MPSSLAAVPLAPIRHWGSLPASGRLGALPSAVMGGRGLLVCLRVGVVLPVHTAPEALFWDVMMDLLPLAHLMSFRLRMTPAVDL